MPLHELEGDLVVDQVLFSEPDEAADEVVATRLEAVAYLPDRARRGVTFYVFHLMWGISTHKVLS